MDENENCEHPDWNVLGEVSRIEGPAFAAGNYAVKVSLTCSWCGLALKTFDGVGSFLDGIETVMYP